MKRNNTLFQLRIQHNWRQQDLADQLNVSLVTVQRWERGSQQPSAYYRAKLHDLFGVNIWEPGSMEPSPSSSESATTAEATCSTEMTSEEIELWTVPYARNIHFTGRDELLDQIKEVFTPSDLSHQQATLTQSCAIKGLGGIGKTQIAIEYAYRAREQKRYMHTLWITAASEEAMLTGFAALAESLSLFFPGAETDQQKLVAAVIDWLERCPHTWLLIMDNADDLSLLHSYLPQRGNGSILLTTRASAIGSLATSIEADGLSLMEGTQFLLRRAHRIGTISDDEVNEATNIVTTLAHLPLAIDQAGAYIEETGCRFSEYLAIYQHHQHTLLSRRSKLAAQYPASVMTTWSLSLQQVEQNNPGAAELLRLCAFLAPDHIHEDLLIGGAPHWPSLLQHAVTDRLIFNQMIEDLLRFSLVKRLTEQRALSIHRLVQVVILERMSIQEQSQWSLRVVRTMLTLFPRFPLDAAVAWPLCQRYLEQMQQCDELIQRYQLFVPESVELLERTGTYLFERALYTLAEPLLQRARFLLAQLAQQNAEPDALAELSLASRQALITYQQGRFEQARNIRQRIFQIWETQEESVHHLLDALSLNYLALLSYQHKHYTQAEQLYHCAIARWEQETGWEHSLITFSLIGLADVYRDQKKYTEAEPLYLRALHIREEQLGPEHFHMANPLTALAHLYREQQRYVEAEPLYLRALRIREEQIGINHAETATLLQEVARFQEERGNTPEAVLFYRRALSIQKNVFGPDHVLTLTTYRQLHVMLANLEKITEKDSGIL